MSSPAGTVVVDFAAETAKFTAELKKVRSELNTLKDQVGNISNQFDRAGRALKGVFTTLAIGAGIRAVVQATEESERAISQLNNALKNSGVSVASASKDYQAFATEMQRVTTFSDEAVIGVESLLLGFRGLSAGTIKQATADVLDLSTRLGIDLDTAAKTVGRALENPIQGLTALRKAGVQFTDAQKDVVKALVQSGQVAEAQQIILKELEGRFEGAAEAARDTFGGAIQGVKNAFDDLLEAKSGLPGATEALNELARTLSSEEMKQGFAALIEGLVKVVELTAKGAALLAEFGAAAGKAVASRLGLDPGLDAAALLTKELAKEQGRLLELRSLLDTAEKTGSQRRIREIQQEIATEEAYIATLRERITLAQESSKTRFLSALPGAADSIIDSIIPQTPAATPSVIGAEEQKALVKQAADNVKLIAETSKEALAQISADVRAQFEQDTADIANAGIEQLAAETAIFDERLRQRELFAAEEAAIEERRRDQVISMEQVIRQQRQATVNAGIGLLQLFAQKSKTAAIALILVNRGLMIAQTIQNTAAAVAKAFAIYGPTPAGAAAAASMKLMGAIQVGLIAATGALEIGQVTSGNSSAVVGPGTPNNPIFTNNGNTGDGQPALNESAINISITGMISQEVIDDMIAKLEDATGRGKIFIRANSNQADEIRRGG